MKIALTSIYVDDPSKAFEFYIQKLGFIKRIYQPDANLAIVASPEDPFGTGLLLEPNDSPIARAYQSALYQAGLPAIVLGVPDVQQVYRRLKNMGVVFQSEPVISEHGTQAVFDDTCGNFVQIHHL
jgi:predicted enzyme related to lactoylglutathione lyase